MYFIGAKSEKNTAAPTWVLVEKTLKNVKKHYHLNAVRRFPRDTPNTEIEDEIIRIYNSREFIVRKRVFSQDRRPAKTVRVHPAIVTETAAAESLRLKRIPAEGVCLCDEDPWRKEAYGPICLGNDYHVPRHEPMQTLLNVFGQNRLIIGDDVPLADALMSAMICLKNQEMPDSDELSEILSVLSLPIWFCETIRSIRRY